MNKIFKTHPGEHLREEIEARGWSQRDLAFILGCPEQAINIIISGKRGISPEMAKALGKAFDVAPEFFANLQKAYDLSQAQDPDPEVELRAKMQNNYPVREMIKRGWIGDSKNGFDLESQLCRFFEVNSLDNAPHMKHAARKTYYEQIPGNQLAWLFRVRQISKEILTPRYSTEKLREAISKMLLMKEAPEEIRHIPRLLSEAGIKFVIVEGLPGGRIDGVCFWLDNIAPVIGMSMRYDRIDNFWFVLMHECSHILHGHGKSSEIIDADLGSENGSEPEEERIANEDAREFCVPKMKMRSFYERKKPFFSNEDVKAFAKINHVHPGLVVGQIHHMSKEYRNLRQHLISVKDFIFPAALVDGWGNILPTT